jgi:hypothetical protein
VEAFFIAVAIVVLLSLWLIRVCPLPMAPMSDRPAPLVLPDDGMPPLPGPAVRAQIAAAKSKPALTRPLVNIAPAASDRAGNAPHRVPAERR